ncbi:MAG: hypothetical protein WCT04_09595 [Planctomycetota bacterium]
MTIGSSVVLFDCLIVALAPFPVPAGTGPSFAPAFIALLHALKKAVPPPLPVSVGGRERANAEGQDRQYSKWNCPATNCWPALWKELENAEMGQFKSQLSLTQRVGFSAGEAAGKERHRVLLALSAI